MNHTRARHSCLGASRRHTKWRALRTMTVSMMLVTAGMGLSATPASADDCPNNALRTQNHSTDLPDCRAYELVSSPFKEGFAPVPGSYTDNDAIGYTSTGNFAGNGLGAVFNQYVARRSATGWLTTSPNPSGPAYDANIRFGAESLSSDLRSSLWLMRRAEDSPELDDYYLRRPDGTFTRIGPGINPATRPPAYPGPAPITTPPETAATSADLSHVLFTLQQQLVFPGDTVEPGVPKSLYEYVGTGNDRPRLVGLDNTGHQISSASTCPNGISNDGQVLFFATGCAGSVWARINGTTSIEMSASECTRISTDPGGVCTGSDDASFAGKAADGSRAFFTTTKQLVNGDTDQTNDLYACDIPPGTPAPVGIANPCAALTQVSGAATGANVESVVRVSKDGSSAYFIAQGVLAANRGANDHAAAAGDHNLYLWQQNAEHPGGKTTFVAKLDTDNLAPDKAAVTDDGRYLLLSTSLPLVDSGPNADTDTAMDVYRYDADKGGLLRLSTASSGNGGNDSTFDASQSAAGPMTSDANTVIFQTSEQLSSTDTDTASDIYEWQDGQVTPITSGGAEQAAITASGKDIFFMTSKPVTIADSDTNSDIYDARVKGGFDLTQPPPCTDDKCKGNRSAPPGLASPPSDALQGDEVADVDAVLSLRAVTAAQRRRLAATGKVSLTVTANTPATLSATATTAIGGRSVAIASARRTMATPGTIVLRLTLSKKARTRLAATGRLTVKIAVTDSQVALPRSVTIKLTHTKSRTKSRKPLARQTRSAVETSRS